MPEPAESLVALEAQLTDTLLDFERLDEAWPKGATAVERAEIGRRREEALSDIVTLHQRIVAGPAETLADAAAQLRRLQVRIGKGDEVSARLLASALGAVEAVA
jgi:hypothetical protein